VQTQGSSDLSVSELPVWSNFVPKFPKGYSNLCGDSSPNSVSVAGVVIANCKLGLQATSLSAWRRFQCSLEWCADHLRYVAGSTRF
jgi:hypothetical protein